MPVLKDLSGKVERRVAPFTFQRRVPMRNTRPVISFTFDDFPASAAQTGALILSSHGAYGTFYAAGGLIGRTTAANEMATRDQVEELHHQGHEIGCHTYQHVGIRELSREARAKEVRDNLSWWRALAEDRRLSSFAYPFGDVSPAAKREMRSEYATCRGTAPGLHAGSVDLSLLRAVGLYDSAINEAQVTHWIEEAVRRNAWLIFYTHDVQKSPTKFGCTPKLLEHAVSVARDHDVDVLPVRSATGRVSFRGA